MSPRATSRTISLEETLPRLKLVKASHDGIAEITSHSPYRSAPRKLNSNGTDATRQMTTDALHAIEAAVLRISREPDDMAMDLLRFFACNN
jgi:hypothetical protein